MSSLSTSDYGNALGRRAARFAVSLMVMLFIALTLIAARASARSVAAAAAVVAPGPGSVEEAVEALVDDALAANLELDGASLQRSRQQYRIRGRCRNRHFRIPVSRRSPIRSLATIVSAK
jgi:hypothetical protein